MVIDVKAFLSTGRAVDRLEGEVPQGEAIAVPAPNGSPDTTIQRLQIAIAGLGAVLLVIGVVNFVMERLDRAEAALVAQTGEAPIETAEPQNDALVDAGLVPDLPAEPEADSPGAGGHFDA